MYGRKSSGPKIPPCGTPGSQTAGEEVSWPILTICLIKRKRTTSEQKEEKKDLIYCEIFDLQFQVSH